MGRAIWRPRYTHEVVVVVGCEVTEVKFNLFWIGCEVTDGLTL